MHYYYYNTGEGTAERIRKRVNAIECRPNSHRNHALRSGGVAESSYIQVWNEFFHSTCSRYTPSDIIPRARYSDPNWLKHNFNEDFLFFYAIIFHYTRVVPIEWFTSLLKKIKKTIQVRSTYWISCDDKTNYINYVFNIYGYEKSNKFSIENNIEKLQYTYGTRLKCKYWRITMCGVRWCSPSYVLSCRQRDEDGLYILYGYRKKLTNTMILRRKNDYGGVRFYIR